MKQWARGFTTSSVKGHRKRAFHIQTVIVPTSPRSMTSLVDKKLMPQAITIKCHKSLRWVALFELIARYTSLQKDAFPQDNPYCTTTDVRLSLQCASSDNKTLSLSTGGNPIDTVFILQTHWYFIFPLLQASKVRKPLLIGQIHIENMASSNPKILCFVPTRNSVSNRLMIKPFRLNSSTT
jgi:hypothetical protein